MKFIWCAYQFFFFLILAKIIELHEMFCCWILSLENGCSWSRLFNICSAYIVYSRTGEISWMVLSCKLSNITFFSVATWSIKHKGILAASTSSLFSFSVETCVDFALVLHRVGNLDPFLTRPGKFNKLFFQSESASNALRTHYTPEKF